MAVTATLIPISVTKLEAMAPKRKATVVQRCPRDSSTAKKITKAIITTKTPINLNSVTK